MCIFIGLLRLSTYPSWVEHVQNMQVSEAYKNIHLYLIFIVSKIKSWAWRNHSLNVFLQFMIYMRVFFFTLIKLVWQRFHARQQITEPFYGLQESALFITKLSNYFSLFFQKKKSAVSSFWRQCNNYEL